MALNDEEVPVLRIVYVKSMWDDAKIWNELLNAKVWPVKYKDGTLKDEEPKFTFKTEDTPSDTTGACDTQAPFFEINQEDDEKAIFYLLACVLLPVAASADEGMWLVSTFRDVIYPQMKKEGLKLKPGEIYNEESPALCNAIVAVDGGMGTGSVISDKGLVITNHHVAYGDIHSLSTPAKNYLEEGFWALEQKDELPLKGKTVTFLRQVRDVTDEAQAIRDSLEKANSLGIFGTRKVYGILERKYGGDTPFEVECASMWKGKKYLLFYYETYKDVRLVGAPPVIIGLRRRAGQLGLAPAQGRFRPLPRLRRRGRPAAYWRTTCPSRPARC